MENIGVNSTILRSKDKKDKLETNSEYIYRGSRVCL